MNISEPSNPKKCMGFTPKADKNQSEIKSRYPLKKRFKPPNFVFPNLRAWC